MPILKTNPETLAQRCQSSFELLVKAFSDNQEVFLRRWFDNAVLDETALAAIRLASELGFEELSTQMIADYNSELDNG